MTKLEQMSCSFFFFFLLISFPIISVVIQNSVSLTRLACSLALWSVFLYLYSPNPSSVFFPSFSLSLGGASRSKLISLPWSLAALVEPVPLLLLCQSFTLISIMQSLAGAAVRALSGAGPWLWYDEQVAVCMVTLSTGNCRHGRQSTAWGQGMYTHTWKHAHINQYYA